MARTMPAELKRFPPMMPTYFTDFKRTNFGVYKNRLVCHDYGVSFIVETATSSKRVRKIEWWDEDR
jgi:hypothetical protein